MTVVSKGWKNCSHEGRERGDSERGAERHGERGQRRARRRTAYNINASGVLTSTMKNKAMAASAEPVTGGPETRAVLQAAQAAGRDPQEQRRSGA